MPAGVGEDQRVVGGGVDLDRDDRAPSRAPRAPRRAPAARSAASTRPARDRNWRATALMRAAVESRQRFAGGRRWPANGRGCVDARVERAARARSASSDSAAAMSAARASRSASASASAAIAVDDLRAVDEREPFLGVEHAPARGRPRRAPRAPASRARAVPDLALADQHQRQVRERRQIAARADRPAAGHERMHAAVEQREQRVERSARMPE